MDSLKQSYAFGDVSPILGKHIPDVVKPCFCTCVLELSGFEYSENLQYIILSSFFAFAQMDSVCLDHVRSEVSGTPKYLKHSTCSSTQLPLLQGAREAAKGIRA